MGPFGLVVRMERGQSNRKCSFFVYRSNLAKIYCIGIGLLEACAPQVENPERCLDVTPKISVCALCTSNRHRGYLFLVEKLSFSYNKIEKLAGKLEISH